MIIELLVYELSLDKQFNFMYYTDTTFLRNIYVLLKVQKILNFPYIQLTFYSSLKDQFCMKRWEKHRNLSSVHAGRLSSEVIVHR